MLKEAQAARPYAIAAFEYATENDALPLWSRMLHALSEVAKEPSVLKIMDYPEYDTHQVAQVVIDLAKDFLNDDAKNFVRLLAQAHRLPVLPEVATLFELFYAKVNQMIDVDVISSIALDDEFKEKLKAALKKRFEREPVLHCTLDENIIGGLVIRAGDEVIDGSIKNQLTKLKDYVVGDVCN